MQVRRFVMKISLSSAVMVLAATSVATAQPKQEETSGRVSHSEKRAGTSHDMPRQPDDWVELADPSPTKHGTTFVMVGRDAGYFGSLRIGAAKGTVVVKRVKVTFEDGKTKVFKLDKALSAKGRRSAIVTLPDARVIDQIAVTTDTRAKGKFTVHGSSSGGVVAGR